MSFFGFEQTNRLQQEKQRFLEGKVEQEDLAVYTWGEDSYDVLGDALLEGGDELNDETFGGTEDIGKFYLQIKHFPTYDEQAGTLILHSRPSRLMSIPDLCQPSPPPSSKLLPSQIHLETRHLPTKLRVLLPVRSSQS
jgi:DNA topoisomerase 2-associated protein PAT1